MYNHIVLNEPHASLEGLYEVDKSYWEMDARFLNDVIIKCTVWHTGYLFYGVQDNRVKTVRFPYSRFVVDTERLWNDPMEKIGQGIVYKSFDDYHRHIPIGSEQSLFKPRKWHQQQLRCNFLGDYFDPYIKETDVKADKVLDNLMEIILP